MKRRVNMNFLVILTVAVVGLGIAAVVAKMMIHDKPEKHIAMAESLYAQGNYEKAAGEYGKAFGLGGKRDLSLMMKQADAWGKLAETDQVYWRNALACWTKSLEINHDYVPALAKLMEFWDEQAKISSPEQRTGIYTSVRDYAARLAKADPTNKAAAAKVPMTMVQAWLVGTATDPKTLDDAVAALAKFGPQDPANAEIPTVLAQSYLKRAQDASQRSDVPGAEKALGQAGGVFDAALKGQDSNVEMQARAAAVYSILSRSPVKEKAAYAEKTKAAIGRVIALAKPTDDKSVDELMTVATLMSQSGDAAGAEAVMKGLVDARPGDGAARRGYARMLAGSAGGRAKAIEVLSAPLTGAMAPASPAKAKQEEAQTLVDLSNLLVEHYNEVKEAPERAALVAKVDSNLNRLQQIGGDSSAYLKLRGQLQLLQGKDTEGIQTLVKAKALTEQQGRRDDQLTYALAGAYMGVRQTGEAKKLLTEMLARHPDFVPARRMMAQMFLSENDPDNAEPHVAILARLLPDDPDVKRQMMAVYMLRKQPEQARKLYDGLPETDRRTKMGKAQVALGIGNNADAVRLLEDVRKEDAKNMTVVRLLVTAYKGQNDLASAQRVVDEAVAANPTDLSLLAMRKQLAGASGDEMVKFTREMVEKTADPYTKEMQLAAISSEEDKGAEALDHLKKAEQLKPDAPQVMEALFQAYAHDAKWDLAAQYADKLGKINADKVNGALYQFRLLMAQAKYPEALQVAQDLSGKMPEFAMTWVTLAQARQVNGNPGGAVEAYLRALEKQSDNADAMRGLVDCYYSQNKPDDALRYITLARRTFPANAYFRDLELRHSLRFGDPDQAVAQWEDARKASPEVRGNWANLAQAYWRALMTHGEQNDAAGSKKYQDALATLAADGAKKWPDERLFYAYQADLAALHGDLATGVAALKQLAAQPAWAGKPEPALLLADYYARGGKFPEAEASAREALAASEKTDNTQAIQKLASIQAMQGHTDDAIKTLDAKSDNPAVARQRLALLVAAHRMDSAEKMALQLLDKEPKAADVINGLVAIYLETGQFDQALARVNQVLTTDPNNVAALYGRGLVELRRPKADLDAAITDLKLVRDKDAKNAEARYWLAEALLAKGDADGAIRELDSAVRIQPDNKALRLRMAAVCAAATPPRWVDAERVLHEGRMAPGMAGDPDLAVAETRMWIARRQAEKAVEVASQAMGAAKGNPDVIRAYMDALLASGNYQRLLNETDKLVAQPDTTPYWVFQGRAVALRRLEKKDEALAEYERALNHKDVLKQDDLAAGVLNSMAEELGIDEALARIAPKAETSPRWQLVQASLYQQKRDYANAIVTVEKMMKGLDKMSPAERVTLLRFAGTMYLSVQPTPQPEKALEAFKLSLKEVPDDTAVLNNMASVLTDYLDPARPQEALQYSQRAYDLASKSGRVEPLVLDTHGRVLTMLNRVPEGIVLLQEAADRTSVPDVHYHLAEAYMLQNNPREAQKHLVQASSAIEKAKKDQQPVDPKMVKRVAELTEQAKKMLETKPQAGRGKLTGSLESMRRIEYEANSL